MRVRACVRACVRVCVRASHVACGVYNLSERGGGGAHFIGNSQRPRLRRMCEPLEPVGLQQSKPI